MYEKLQNLLKEWELYKSHKEDTPSRIIDKELESIAKSVDVTVTEMRGSGELEKITQEEWSMVNEIYDLLTTLASKRNVGE